MIGSNRWSVRGAVRFLDHAAHGPLGIAAGEVVSAEFPVGLMQDMPEVSLGESPVVDEAGGDGYEGKEVLGLALPAAADSQTRSTTHR
ncbi:hypothetical protein [Streptomyces sp. NPDC053431]|uniref:hypothetical protein n=1 Tax=Streptomyces sp. NPDC053431 TaxID=3365703 RepID=UPI0037CE3E00